MFFSLAEMNSVSSSDTYFSSGIFPAGSLLFVLQHSSIQDYPNLTAHITDPDY